MRLRRQSARRPTLDKARGRSAARDLPKTGPTGLGSDTFRPMSFAEIPAEVDGFGTGEVSLVGPEVLRELLRAAEDEGYLSVVLSPPGPGQRGELALIISEAIEIAKNFGAPDSARFVNGVVDRISRNVRKRAPQEERSPPRAVK